MNPTGLCQCGCGQPAPIAKQTRKREGHIKGQPLRFIHGHGGRFPNGEAHPNYGKFGADSPVWNGGRYARGDGYIICTLSPDHQFAAMAFIGSGSLRVFEHRLVMAEAIGRALTPEEVVHHIDGDPSNNALENLMLFENDTAHQRHHAELRAAARKSKQRRKRSRKAKTAAVAAA
jgi:hypothetical protein